MMLTQSSLALKQQQSQLRLYSTINQLTNDNNDDEPIYRIGHGYDIHRLIEGIKAYLINNNIAYILLIYISSHIDIYQQYYN